MGNGTYSDGIYKFNLTSHQFQILEYLYIPTFLKYCETNKTYYTGSFNSGLLSSTDGIVWTTVPYFKTLGCSSMDFYNNHFVVTQNNNIYAIYYSNDTGRTWLKSSPAIPLSYLIFNPSGKLFGICPGKSGSSGLYSSTDFGQSWKLCYQSFDMNTIGFDVINSILVGWKSTGIDEGIAKFNESTSSMFFLNDGLPNKNINKIQFNLIFSSITIFCSTDSGVYFSNNYYNAEIQKNDLSANALSAIVYPNPTSGVTTVEYTLPLNAGKQDLIFSLYNSYGNLIKEFLTNGKYGVQNSLCFDVSDLIDGLYYFRLKSGNSEITNKLIILK